MRELDNPIPPTEELYRSVAFGESQGDALLWHAIETATVTSVSRSKYLAKLDDALKGTDTGLAVTTPERLPPPMTSSGGVVHEIRAEDDPVEGNEAHAEIRVRRKGRDFEPKYNPKSTSFKLELRHAIARSFKVVRPPEPPSE